ncbi:ribonuclease domain-containing protein [Nocardia sp. NPDC127579]|uniref:ribonuclease domain-containing protein n=1 Tax=Nocardia sp. NPDC127579 TaxID=3345402 RepID=UPI003639DD6F
MRLTPVRAFGALAAIVVVVLLGILAARGTDTTPASAPGTTAARTATSTSAGPTQVAGVPDRAYATLREIDAGRWPKSANSPGTKGGEQWMNRDNQLSRTDAAGGAITYQEWDVNPKQRNRSRDAERIVTGSDGTAWYTGDHYKTFTRMR